MFLVCFTIILALMINGWINLILLHFKILLHCIWNFIFWNKLIELNTIPYITLYLINTHLSNQKRQKYPCIFSDIIRRYLENIWKKSRTKLEGLGQMNFRYCFHSLLIIFFYIVKQYPRKILSTATPVCHSNLLA